ncbi:hypothetical protein VTJ04DRAFT_1441 [Mycothermus thermophilus]|uniref:uncharacterized protein n=1 Tax=Humicola insolens TaxID=85995 RepID=UPI003743E534
MSDVQLASHSLLVIVPMLYGRTVSTKQKPTIHCCTLTANSDHAGDQVSLHIPKPLFRTYAFGYFVFHAHIIPHHLNSSFPFCKYIPPILLLFS